MGELYASHKPQARLGDQMWVVMYLVLVFRNCLNYNSIEITVFLSLF